MKMRPRFLLMGRLLINFFVGLITAHFTQCVFQHYILLEQVVYRYFAFCVVVHRALEEEAQEALCAVASGACRKIAEQYEVQAQRCCED